MSRCGMRPQAWTPTLFLFSTKALKLLQDPLLLKKAIWNTFIINQPFLFSFVFSSFSPLLIPNPHPRSCRLCRQRTVCIRTSSQWTCYFSVDTEEDRRNMWLEKRADHLTEKELLLMHGNFIKLFYNINYQYQL